MNTKINKHICLKLTYVTDFKILPSMTKPAQIQKWGDSDHDVSVQCFTQRHTAALICLDEKTAAKPPQGGQQDKRCAVEMVYQMATMPHPDTIHFQVFYPPCCGDEWEQTLNKYSNIKLITQCVGTFLFTEPICCLFKALGVLWLFCFYVFGSWSMAQASRQRQLSLHTKVIRSEINLPHCIVPVIPSIVLHI